MGPARPEMLAICHDSPWLPFIGAIFTSTVAVQTKQNHRPVPVWSRLPNTCRKWVSIVREIQPWKAVELLCGCLCVGKSSHFFPARLGNIVKRFGGDLWSRSSSPKHRIPRNTTSEKAMLDIEMQETGSSRSPVPLVIYGLGSIVSIPRQMGIMMMHPSSVGSSLCSIEWNYSEGTQLESVRQRGYCGRAHKSRLVTFKMDVHVFDWMTDRMIFQRAILSR